MSELWGMTSGFRTYQQDQMALQRLALEKQQLEDTRKYREGVLEQQRVEQEAKDREAAAKKQAEDEQRRILSEAASGFDLNQTAGRLAAYNAGAAALASRGMFTQATAISNTAAQELQRLEAAENSNAARAKAEYELEAQKVGKLQELFSSVDSPEAFNRAKLLASQIPELADTLDDDLFKAYDPQMIQTFVQSAPSYLQQRRLKMEEGEAASRKRLRDARIDDMGARRRHSEAVLEYRKSRDEAAEKAGAVAPSRTAGKNELGLVRDTLKQKGYLLSEEALDPGLQTRSIAEEAMTLVQRNRGVSWAQAVEQAIEDAERRGELVKGEKNRFLPDDKPKFNRREGSIARPLDIPTDPKVPLKKDFNYRHPNGGIARWTGTTWVPVAAPPGRAPVVETGRAAAAQNPLRDVDFDDEE